MSRKRLKDSEWLEPEFDSDQEEEDTSSKKQKVAERKIVTDLLLFNKSYSKDGLIRLQFFFMLISIQIYDRL
jgi:hypothetical protein